MQNCKMMVLDGLIFFLYMCYSQVDHPQQRPVGSDFLSAGSSGKGAKATESLGAVEVLSASQCLLKFLLHFDCNMRIVSMESMIYIYTEYNIIQYIYTHHDDSNLNIYLYGDVLCLPTVYATCCTDLREVHTVAGSNNSTRFPSLPRRQRETFLNIQLVHKVQ